MMHMMSSIHKNSTALWTVTEIDSWKNKHADEQNNNDHRES